MNNKLFFLIIFLLAHFGLSAQTNRALLIAIDQYPEESGWLKIHASNDLKILLPMLGQNGYKSENICVLLNEAATKQAIIKALKAMVSQSGRGDHVYIHFSCHGQNMIDDDGDEDDGLDEALIPYDALRRYSKGKYEGENHLRDDELNMYLEKIRKKITSSGNLVVLLDACHSGTGSREGDDDEYIRGTSAVFSPAGYEIPEIDSAKTVQRHHQQEKNLSAIAVFGACQADETNYEYKDPVTKEYYGRLSYTFCKIMKNRSEKHSANQIFEALEREMQALSVNRKRKQTPYYETTDETKSFYIGK